MKKYDNLVIVRKPKGRSYEYKGQKVEAPWTLKDISTDKTYATYEDYVVDTEQTKKKETFAKRMKEGKAKAAAKKADTDKE